MNICNNDKVMVFFNFYEYKALYALLHTMTKEEIADYVGEEKASTLADIWSEINKRDSWMGSDL